MLRIFHEEPIARHAVDQGDLSAPRQGSILIADADIGARAAGREEIFLRNQNILLELLRVLTEKCQQGGRIAEQGASKAEIFRRVWGEEYRSTDQNNKLYYSINRLRNLIEPNSRRPVYIQSWKDSYRLTPDLRVRLIEMR